MGGPSESELVNWLIYLLISGVGITLGLLIRNLFDRIGRVEQRAEEALKLVHVRDENQRARISKRVKDIYDHIESFRKETKSDIHDLQKMITEQYKELLKAIQEK